MDFCKTVDLFMPPSLPPLRARLIRRHMEDVHAARLLSRDEAKRLMVGPTIGAPTPSGGGSGEPRVAPVPGLILAAEPGLSRAGAAMAAIVALAGSASGGRGLRFVADAASPPAGSDRLCQRRRRARPDVRLSAPGDGHRLRVGLEESLTGGVI
jgi:hypothetical protein